MLLLNKVARLITINGPQVVERDPETNKIMNVTRGDKYNLMPAGDAVDVPSAMVKKLKFVQALIDDKSIEVLDDGDDSDGDGLDKMKVAELKVLAQSLEVEHDPAIKKADLLVLIRAKNAEVAAEE